jgi:hypothetical protein
MGIVNSILQKKRAFTLQTGKEPTEVVLGRFEIAQLKKLCLVETEGTENTVAGLRVTPIDADICVEVHATENEDSGSNADDELFYQVQRMCDIILGEMFGNRELDSLAFEVGHDLRVLRAKKEPF